MAIDGNAESIGGEKLMVLVLKILSRNEINLKGKEIQYKNKGG